MGGMEVGDVNVIGLGRVHLYDDVGFVRVVYYIYSPLLTNATTDNCRDLMVVVF